MTNRVTCHILDSGYCLASEHHLMQGAPKRRVNCHNLVGLMLHPMHGPILFDSGYSSHMLNETHRFPYRLYRFATPLHLDPRLAICSQLSKFSLEPRDIRFIIVSHFHADHIAGLRDFPQAKFIAMRSAFDSIKRLTGFFALRRGFVPKLLPDDFATRCRFIDEEFNGEIPVLGRSVDLFDDGSLQLFELQGHAKGQLGLLAKTQNGLRLFVADSCYHRDSIYQDRPPHRITRFFVDDYPAIQETLKRLNAYLKRDSNIVPIPSHCSATYAEHCEHISR